MCNSYRVTPKSTAIPGLREKVSAAARGLASPLVRKSDPGLVVLPDECVRTMRWGFHRSFNPSINNARSDKLESRIWRDALRERRCIIPMSSFYEWGPATGRRKQAHEFEDPENDYLWIAGIWEENDILGPCFTMITTESPPQITPIHQRMPAILKATEVPNYLHPASHWHFQPFAGPLRITPCESPLAKPKPQDPQQELF